MHNSMLFSLLGLQNDCSKQKFILGKTDDQLIDLTRGPASSGQCAAQEMFDPVQVEQKIVTAVEEPSDCPPGDLVSPTTSYTNREAKVGNERKRKFEPNPPSPSSASTSSCAASSPTVPAAKYCNNFQASWVTFIDAYLKGVLDKKVFQDASEWIQLKPNHGAPKESKVLCFQCSTFAPVFHLVPRNPGPIMVGGAKLKKTRALNRAMIKRHEQSALHLAVGQEILKQNKDAMKGKSRFKEKPENVKTNFVTRTVYGENIKAMSLRSHPLLMLMQGN